MGNISSPGPITRSGFNKIQEELERLIKVEREAIKKALQEAREMGDLKENAEYHAAKEKQALNEGKIARFQSIVNKAKVVDTESIVSDKIVFGATVHLFDPNKQKKVTYKIVGEDESSFGRGLISFSGPLGRALIGREEGDVVVVKVPKGEIEYEIEAFEYK